MEALRPMAAVDAVWLASWEAAERPYPWTEKSFLDTLVSETSQTLIWEQPSGLVGFAVLQRVDTEAHLLNFMVKKELRRRGWGLKLLELVGRYALAAGATDMVLDVDPANESAVRLYEKGGFERIERRPRSYPRGEDALIMRKKL